MFKFFKKEKPKTKELTKEEKIKKRLLMAAHDYITNKPYSVNSLKGPKFITFERRNHE